MNDPHPLTGVVAQTCLDTAVALDGLSDTAAVREAAALIRAEVHRLRAGAAVCVVAGETKRGKSSVINALIGARDLLPVDADVATATYVEVRHGDSPSARVHLKPPATAKDIDIAELAMYAAVDPETGRPRRDDVDRVDLRHPAPLLDGLCLVDTPGVGGLDAGHRAITLAALSRADALVFVVSGARELTRSELTFLVAATERIATVLFVLAQADKYPSWPAVLDRNLALLAEHAAQYTEAPWFVLSSFDEMAAGDAGRAGDTVTAERLRERGGFGPFTVALADGVVARAQELRLANALQVVTGALAVALPAGRRRLRAMTDDPLLVAEIKELQEKLADLERQDAAWRQGLRKRSKLLGDELTLGFRRRLGELRARVEDRIAGSDPTVVDGLPADLADGLDGIWLDVQQAAEQGFGDIVTEIAAHFPDLAATDRPAPELPERLRNLPTVTQTAHDQTGPMATIERLIPAGRSGAVTLAVVGFLTGGVGWAAWIVSVVVTEETVRRRFRREKLTRARGDANRYLGRIVAQAQVEVTAQIKRMVGDTVTALTDGITAWIAEERRVLEADLAEFRKSHRRNTAELTARRERLTAAIGTAESLLARAHELGTAVDVSVTIRSGHGDG